MRTHAPPLRFVAAAALVGALAASPPARADGLALDRFDPAPAGDRLFGVQSPFAAGEQTLHLMLLGDYAREPLVLRSQQSGDQVGTIVSDQFLLHLNGSFALWKKLTLNVDLPMILAQGGDSPSGRGQTFASPSGAELGDVRLGGRYTLLGGYFDAVQLALGGYLWLPTGAKGSFASDGTVRFTPQLILGGRRDRTVWSVAAGPQLRSSQDYGSITQGTMLELGGGLGFLLDDAENIQVGPEMKISTVIEDPDTRNSNAEILLDGRYRFLKDFEGGVGVGPGLSSGIGTPTVRLVAMVAYTPKQVPPPGDRDKDGITDDKDACPDVPGVASADPAKNGCPDRDKDGIVDSLDACPDVPGVATSDPTTNGCPSDRDKDGIIDDKDACPDVPGVADPDPKKNGCPPPGDRDKDGITDDKDACPDLPGVATDDPKTNGCPPDTDGDGIRDDKDACPKEKGIPNEDPAKNGCPQVQVTEQQIVINEQVQFDTDKASIRKESDQLLDNVAKVLKDHPEIAKIEVQGHTDDRGPAAHNKTLSQARADSVKKALVARGIDAKRLTAKGYGQDVPLVPNDSDANRQKNRRVEFKIMEKAAK